MNASGITPELLCERADEVSALLKLAANPQRLLLLCRMCEGEASVGELIELTRLSQSSVSQHLARMREGEIVSTRREQTTIYYSISNDHVAALLQFLCDRFGKPPEAGGD